MLGAITVAHTSRDSPSVTALPPDEGVVLADVDSMRDGRSISHHSASGHASMPSDDCRRAPLTDSVSPEESPLAAATLRIDDTSALHPFSVHKSDAGPFRLMTIAHAFNYRMAVLRDGVKSAVCVGRSHDENGSLQMNMYSLGVMDLDLSISPDVFGLRAFDADKPVSRMLPGSTPCELRLMLPDAKLGIDGFHDVIENLTASPSWMSSHVSPADITSLRRRWPKAVFSTLCRWASDVERLRRDAPKRVDKAFRYSGPGFCGVCDTRVYTALDAHMIACHLELGQLWRCPVEWCVVWKGSGEFSGETWGIEAGGHDERCKVFPPWTVTRDVWHAALRPDVSGVAVDALLFHEAGHRLVHRYRVYIRRFPHPALRDSVIPRLLSCVCQAMAIARLTHLKISIPSWGTPPGQVPAECFPGGGGGGGTPLVPQPLRHHVSFADEVTMLGEEKSRSVHRCFHH